MPDQLTFRLETDEPVEISPGGLTDMPSFQGTTSTIDGGVAVIVKRRLTVTGLAAVLSAVSLFVGPSVAGATPGEAKAVAEALATDAANYAAYWRVTQAEALTRLEAQDAAGMLSGELEARMDPWFGGLWIEHDPFVIVVGYVGSPDAAKDLTSSGGLAKFIELRQRDVSLSELRRIEARAQAQLDPKISQVDVSIPDGKVVVTALDASKSTELLRVLKSDDLDYIDVRQVSAFGHSTVDIYGGLAAVGCTWGFSVIENVEPPRTGIMTAGHCSNNQSFGGTNLPLIRASATDPCCNRDSQWHTTPNIADRNWVVDNANGHTRIITARRAWANVAVGSTLCKYGRSTHYTCGEVLSKTDKPSWIDNVSAVWIKVGRNGVIMSSTGDSGGPLFSGATAFGITQGAYFEFFGTADGVFGSITHQEQFLAVTIKTS